MAGFKVEHIVKIQDDDDKAVKPKPGQTVSLHYTGTLTNGKIFDSSRDRGKPFQFMLGKGQVIRGWDEGVAQLKVGEKAKFICPPEYAYGQAGYPGVIPENATLIFEVELLAVDKDKQ